jgi:hypothetical protein
MRSIFQTARRVFRAIIAALVLALATMSPPVAVRAAADATITVTTALDHPDLFSIDTTNDGVCNDQVTVQVGLLFVPFTACSLRSALKTSFETVGEDLIVFSASLNGAILALKGNALNWASSGVTLDGQNLNIVLSGAAMNANQDIVQISGSGNVIRSLSLTAAKRDALAMGDLAGVGLGNNNTADLLNVYENGNGIGVSISGSGAGGGLRNQVLQSTFAQPTGAACDPARNNLVNIRVSGGAVDTGLINVLAFCGDVAGIQVFGASTAGTFVFGGTIGGGPFYGARFGNGVGIHVQDAKRTAIYRTIVRSSTSTGIYINGPATNDVFISGVTVGDIDRGGPDGLAGENGGDGVLIQNVMAGAITLDQNSVQGNTRDGVRVENSRQITITGNTVGFYEQAGVTYVARNVNGVSLIGNTQQTRVLSNTIAYNENLGVWISGGSTLGNGVAGNRIHSNQNTGVEISGGADFNAIGAESFSLLGIAGVAGNSIYSNTREGVYIAGVGTSNNLVVANTIGAYQGQIYPNGLNGVLLNDRASNNLIGTVVPGLDLSNHIGGNGGNGIWITNQANNNTVQGNAIGSIREIWGAAGNGQNGILLSNNVTGNQIGGATDAESNIAFFNFLDGLALSGATVVNNPIGANRFDLNVANGIGIYDGASTTFTGVAGNPLLSASQNGRTGVYVSGSNANVFTNVSARANHDYGFLIDNGDNNSISLSVAQGNGYDGIAERNGAVDNTWFSIFTGLNRGLGIDRDASSDAADVVAASTVTITAYNVSSGAMTVSGLTPSTSYEVYLADPDPSGYGEGERVSVAFSTGPGGTTASIVIPPGDRATNCFTVLQTTAPSSEFSQNYCRLTPQSIDFPVVAARTLAQPLAFSVVATATSALPVAFLGLTPAVCGVDSLGAVTIVTTGLCQIRASQPGNGVYGPAMPVVQSFSVSKAPQAIAFAQPADRAFGGAPFGVVVTSTSGLAVALGSATPAVCTVSGATVTLTGVGVCTLQATQPGNATYDAATPMSRSFDVTQGAQTITFAQPPNANLLLGTVNVNASASSGLTVTFSGGTAGVCTVAATGRVTLLGPGECALTASQPGDTNYAAATPVTRTLSVRRTVVLPFIRR